MGCKDDVYLAFKTNENLKFCTMMYRMAMPHGIDCFNNQTLLIACCHNPVRLDGIEMLHLTNCYVSKMYFLIGWYTRSMKIWDLIVATCLDDVLMFG